MRQTDHNRFTECPCLTILSTTAWQGISPNDCQDWLLTSFERKFLHQLICMLHDIFNANFWEFRSKCLGSPKQKTKYLKASNSFSFVLFTSLFLVDTVSSFQAPLQIIFRALCVQVSIKIHVELSTFSEQFYHTISMRTDNPPLDKLHVSTELHCLYIIAVYRWRCYCLQGGNPLLVRTGCKTSVTLQFSTKSIERDHLE